jgi:hypothetical protein
MRVRVSVPECVGDVIAEVTTTRDHGWPVLRVIDDGWPAEPLLGREGYVVEEVI